MLRCKHNLWGINPEQLSEQHRHMIALTSIYDLTTDMVAQALSEKRRDYVTIQHVVAYPLQRGSGAPFIPPRS